MATLQQLEAAILCAAVPPPAHDAAAVERNRQAIAFIDQFRSSPQGARGLFHVLSSSPHRAVRFQCLRLLQDIVGLLAEQGEQQLSALKAHASAALDAGRFPEEGVGGEGTPLGEMSGLRRAMWEWVTGNMPALVAEPTFVLAKAAVVLARLLKYLFPCSWQSAVADIVGIAQTGGRDGQLLFLRILLHVDDEIIHSAHHVGHEDLSQHATVLKDALRVRGVVDIVETWFAILSASIAADTEVATLCLSTIQLYISWIDIQLVTHPRFLNLFFSALDSRHAPLRAAACLCVQRIVEKGMPAERKFELLQHLRMPATLERLPAVPVAKGGDDESEDEGDAPGLEEGGRRRSAAVATAELIAAVSLQFHDTATTDEQISPAVRSGAMGFFRRTMLGVGFRVALCGRPAVVEPLLEPCTRIAILAKRGVAAGAVAESARIVAASDPATIVNCVHAPANLEAPIGIVTTTRKDGTAKQAPDPSWLAEAIARLLSLCVQVLRWPIGYQFEQCTNAPLEEYVQYRRAATKVLQNVAFAAPDTCAVFVSKLFNQPGFNVSALHTLPPRDVEAALAFLFDIADAVVKRAERVNQHSPIGVLVASLVSHWAEQGAVAVPAVAKEALRVLSRFACTAKERPDLAVAMVQLVMGRMGLRSGSRVVRGVAPGILSTMLRELMGQLAPSALAVVQGMRDFLQIPDPVQPGEDVDLRPIPPTAAQRMFEVVGMMAVDRRVGADVRASIVREVTVPLIQQLQTATQRARERSAAGAGAQERDAMGAWLDQAFGCAFCVVKSVSKSPSPELVSLQLQVLDTCIAACVALPGEKRVMTQLMRLYNNMLSGAKSGVDEGVLSRAPTVMSQLKALDAETLEAPVAVLTVLVNKAASKSAGVLQQFLRPALQAAIAARVQNPQDKQEVETLCSAKKSVISLLVSMLQRGLAHVLVSEPVVQDIQSYLGFLVQSLHDNGGNNARPAIQAMALMLVAYLLPPQPDGATKCLLPSGVRPPVPCPLGEPLRSQLGGLFASTLLPAVAQYTMDPSMNAKDMWATVKLRDVAVLMTLGVKTLGDAGGQAIVGGLQQGGVPPAVAGEIAVAAAGMERAAFEEQLIRFRGSSSGKSR